MRSIEQRNELVEKHLGLAERLASNRHRSVNSTVQYGDLLSAAYTGLIDAAERFDETKADDRATSPFVTYARSRINGEMNDYLRACSWGTRSHPRQVMSLERSAVSGHDSTEFEPDSICNVGDFMSKRQRTTIDDMSGEEVFNKVIRGLPRQEKKVFQLRYLYGLTMKEVGDNIGISESRVSQILSSGTEYLREVWSHRESDIWDEVLVQL